MLWSLLGAWLSQHCSHLGLGQSSEGWNYALKGAHRMLCAPLCFGVSVDLGCCWIPVRPENSTVLGLCSPTEPQLFNMSNTVGTGPVVQVPLGAGGGGQQIHQFLVSSARVAVRCCQLSERLSVHGPALRFLAGVKGGASWSPQTRPGSCPSSRTGSSGWRRRSSSGSSMRSRSATPSRRPATCRASTQVGIRWAPPAKLGNCSGQSATG